MSASSRFFKGVKLKEAETLLLEDPLALFSCFRIKHEDPESLGIAIEHIFYARRRSPDLLKVCASQEILSTTSSDQLLRQDNLHIIIMQNFIKRTGKQWLTRLLSRPLRRLLQANISIEIDKMRLPADEDLPTNLQQLKLTISGVLDPILDFPENFPSEIRTLSKLLFVLTNDRFPGEGYRVLSSSVFLRFICSIIGSPSFWRVLVKSEVTPIQRRKFILVAKVVQGIANETTQFNESYMNVLEEFMEMYINKLRGFYDHLVETATAIHNMEFHAQMRRKAQLSQSQLIIYEFFRTNFLSITNEIAAPLLPIYSASDLFKQRLELLLWDDISPEWRSMHSSARPLVKREVNLRLKCLRDKNQTNGEKIWSVLFACLRHVTGEDVFMVSASNNDPPLSPKSSQSNRKGRMPEKSDSVPRTNSRFTGGHTGILSHDAVIQKKHHQWSPMSERHDPLSSMGDVSNNEEYSDEYEKKEEEIALPVYEWLQSLGCEEYLDIFIKHDITSLEVLCQLSDRDLLDMGVINGAHRDQMLASFHSHSRHWNKVSLKNNSSPAPVSNPPPSQPTSQRKKRKAKSKRKGQPKRKQTSKSSLERSTGSSA